MLSFFSRDVLDGILNLIESVSEGFPTLLTKFGHAELGWLFAWLLYHNSKYLNDDTV